MTKHIAIYHQSLRYDLTLVEGRRYHLSGSDNATVMIEGLEHTVILTLDNHLVTYQWNDLSGEVADGQEVVGLTFYGQADDFQVYDCLDKQEFLLGTKTQSDLILPDGELEVLLQREHQAWQLSLLSGQLFVNNQLFTGNELALSLGDELAYQGFVFKVFPDELWVRGAVAVTPGLVPKAASRYGFYPDYPDFHRSPRIIYRSSEDKIQINAPAAEPKKPENGLLRMIVPPLVMIAVMILISLIQPRGIYMLMMLAMSTTTIIFSVTTYFKNRKKYQEELADRITSYKRYVMDKSMELAELASEQKQGQLYHYPAIETLNQLSETYHHRIYEKTPLHFDFLHYRLGLGKVPTSYELRYAQTERSGQTDPLEAEGYKLYTANRTITGMPIVANLANGPVGYIGPRPLVIEQLQLMVNQLALFHSYHDVQFITIMPEEEKEQWEWMRWLPHATLQEMNVRGFVYNQRTRDQVLNSLNQILKLRKNQLEDKSAKESLLFSPHYVVLVTDEKLILDHVIMEFFSEDPRELGCSVIFVEDVLSSLSENIQTIINIKDRNVGQLVMEEGELKETDFALDHFPADFDKESIARRLAPLNHLQNLKSSIPESVTFMEMYAAEEFQDLHVPERWADHAPYKSLAVPLGLRGQNDLVYLNLHEKAHGPHGLIAGTTGSGKSELIQSYILSLAVNFHPYDVAFLLIDYKGGGMANLFKNLPHLLGTITNLDGAQSMRALVSINAELKRRQRLFAKYDVNHINQYQKKYKLGEVDEPMPHLFLISDEFAELKQNQPDFMTELVSTARIGRSLGIHLILATQKPTGVVNEQIWSNSRFKIALKVADRQDSNEMLHTPDAAEITQTGRAYLQVGNNEVYELFQSAWSGADYQPDKDDQGIEDHTIYAINSLGQYDILNEDLSGLEDAEDIRQVPSELDAIVTNLHGLVANMGMKPLPQPWLPPLAREVYVQDLRPQAFTDLWETGTGSLTALLGMVDLPSQQDQRPLYHDFDKDGNLILYGAPGMGKSTFLQTVVMDLARQNTPELMHFYLFDFGTNGLLPLRHLPHVADSFLMEDTEKISKFILRMREEIAKRKKLFSRYGVSNMGLYRQLSGDPLPQVLIVIDSYDGIKEAELGDQLEATIQTLVREGSSLGIMVVITAGRLGVIKSALQAGLKTRLSLKLTDDNDTRTVIGRHEYVLEDIPGRGLAKLDQPEVFQVALPARGLEAFQIIQTLQEEAGAMAKAWQGERPKAIPIVPEKLTVEAFAAKESVQSALEQGNLPIGLDMIKVESVSMKLDNTKNIIILGDNKVPLNNVLSHLVLVAYRLSTKVHILVVDASDDFIYLKENSNVYINSELSDKLLTQMTSELEERKLKQKNNDTFIVIPDLAVFLDKFLSQAEKFKKLYTEGPKYGLHFVIAGTKAVFFKTDSIVKIIKEEIPTALVAMRMYDQSIIPHKENSREQQLTKDQVYFYHKGKYDKLKITNNEEIGE